MDFVSNEFFKAQDFKDKDGNPASPEAAAVIANRILIQQLSEHSPMFKHFGTDWLRNLPSKKEG